MWQWCRHTLKSREIWMGWRQWTESCVRSASLDTFGFLLVVDKTCPDVWSSLRPIQGMSLSIWCSEQPSGRCQWCLEWSRRSPWSWEKRNDFCKSLGIPNIPVASNIPGFVSVWRLAILPFIFPGEFGHPIFSVQTWKGNSIFFILIGLSMVHGEWRPCNSTDVPIRARIVSSLDALIPSFFSGRLLKETLPTGVGYFHSVTNEDAVFVLLVGARYYFLVIERQADHLFPPWCCSFRTWRRYEHCQRSVNWHLDLVASLGWQWQTRIVRKLLKPKVFVEASL